MFVIIDKWVVVDRDIQRDVVMLGVYEQSIEKLRECVCAALRGRRAVGEVIRATAEWGYVDGLGVKTLFGK